MAVERVEFGSCSCFQTNSSFQRHSVPVVAVVEVDRMHQRQMRVDFVVVAVVVAEFVAEAGQKCSHQRD